MPVPSLIALVILISLVLTGYELLKIFDRNFGRALRNRYALLMAVLNIITATLVWTIIHNALAVPPTILTALITGLTFPALLRSRFTLYRSIGSGDPGEVDELSLKMDEMYQYLQRRFFREVNLQLATERQAISQQIRKIFTARQLANYLQEFIDHEPLAEERQKDQTRLDAILTVDDKKKRHRQLVNLLFDFKTRAQIKAIIKNKAL